MNTDRRVLGADNGITEYRKGSVEVYITMRSQANLLSPTQKRGKFHIHIHFLYVPQYSIMGNKYVYNSIKLWAWYNNFNIFKYACRSFRAQHGPPKAFPLSEVMFDNLWTSHCSMQEQPLQGSSGFIQPLEARPTTINTISIHLKTRTFFLKLFV